MNSVMTTQYNSCFLKGFTPLGHKNLLCMCLGYYVLNVKGINNLPCGVGGRSMCRLLSRFSNVTGQDVYALYNKLRLQGLY